MPEWVHTLETIDPRANNTGTWHVGVTKRKIALLLDKGHQVKAFRLRLVEEVVADPALILQGWSRPGMEDCYVYVGQPAKDWRSATIETPPPPNMLFVVFILPDGTIDDWNWREKSVNDPSLPDGIDGKVVWP